MAIRERWVVEITHPNEDFDAEGHVLKMNLPNGHDSTWLYYLDLTGKALFHSPEPEDAQVS